MLMLVSVTHTARGPVIELRHRLRIARQHAGLDQEALADKIGVTRTTISHAESGRNVPHLLTLRAWAQACDVDLSWLIIDDCDQPAWTDPTEGLSK